MGNEVERKYIVKDINKFPKSLTDYEHKEFLQGYIDTANPRYEHRLRREGNKYFHTIKSRGGLVRKERERKLTKEVFDKMWKRVESGLEKTRYFIPYAGRTIELDVYGGRLSGYVMAEVEFKPEMIKESKHSKPRLETLEEVIEKSRKFVPPEYFGLEVTEDKRYKNQYISKFGFPEDHFTRKEE